jgi:hypothetical protein
VHHSQRLSRSTVHGQADVRQQPAPFLIAQVTKPEAFSTELSEKKWRLAFTDGEKVRQVTFAAGDFAALKVQIVKARKHFKVAPELPMHSCYEMTKLQRCRFRPIAVVIDQEKFKRVSS